jgi:alpha-tubulin suppressor-like RCC1 family protein
MPINCSHTLLLDPRGTIFACGLNDAFQLGIIAGGDNLELFRSELSPTGAPTKFVAVAAGYGTHSIAIAEDASLWTWGNGHSGELGLGQAVFSVQTPTQIPETQGFVAVVAGNLNSLALDKDGYVYGMGSNSRGELGLGKNVASVFTLTRLPLRNITMISAGMDHFLALDSNGKVWSSGANRLGQSGHTTGLGSIVTPRMISNLNNIQQIASGNSHNLALDEKNRAWSFGWNVDGQLGIGGIPNSYTPTKVANISGKKIIQVYCGSSSSYLKDSNEFVYVFGNNGYGQLALGDYLNRNCPTLNDALSGMHLFPQGGTLFCVDPGQNSQNHLSYYFARV